MPPDPTRVAESRPWFTKAAQDLRAVEVLLAADPPLLGEAAYHCQQAAEKSSKGFLSWHAAPFGKTHGLAAKELRRALIPLAAAFEKWRPGRLESGELVDIIHRFHDGPAREIWKDYAYARESALARAIATGVIERDKVPAEVLDFLGSAIEYYARDSRGDGSS